VAINVATTIAVKSALSAASEINSIWHLQMALGLVFLDAWAGFLRGGSVELEHFLKHSALSLAVESCLHLQSSPNAVPGNEIATIPTPNSSAVRITIEDDPRHLGVGLGSYTRLGCTQLVRLGRARAGPLVASQPADCRVGAAAKGIRGAIAIVVAADRLGRM
jgi:hypothetical protein